MLSRSWRDTPFQGKATRHFETALGTVLSSFCWDDPLTRVHRPLAHRLFLGGNRFDNAHPHIERANSHAGNDAYYLGHAMELQAGLYIEVVGLRKQDALRR